MNLACNKCSIIINDDKNPLPMIRAITEVAHLDEMISGMIRRNCLHYRRTIWQIYAWDIVRWHNRISRLARNESNDSDYQTWIWRISAKWHSCNIAMNLVVNCNSIISDINGTSVNIHTCFVTSLNIFSSVMTQLDMICQVLGNTCCIQSAHHIPWIIQDNHWFILLYNITILPCPTVSSYTFSYKASQVYLQHMWSRAYRTECNM